MIDRPILFSEPMIRAQLEGRKIMTRRIVKPQPETFKLKDGFECPVELIHVDGRPWPQIATGLVITAQEVRYKPGMRLWVRETWCPAYSENGPVLLTRADFGRRYLVDENFPVDYSKFPAGRSPWVSWAADVENGTTGDWKPSIFMPRWASRLTLTVTAVKIERLQDITPTDAMAEGIKNVAGTYGVTGIPSSWFATPIESFEAIWSHINGPASWGANPFVVAVSFTVHKCNIDKISEAA